MKLVAAIAVAVSVLSSAPALAAAPKPVPPKLEVHDFAETVIMGDFGVPGADPVLSYRRARFTSLLKTRTDFLPELEKSVDRL